ncbi:MAG: hypothetical protein MRJ65_04900 [Candidatus Brocadiaceae bacterium]|nr:hypothetical protein [Candidatus Brocadiaceae bacterium]
MEKKVDGNKRCAILVNTGSPFFDVCRAELLKKILIDYPIRDLGEKPPLSGENFSLILTPWGGTKAQSKWRIL